MQVTVENLDVWGKTVIIDTERSKIFQCMSQSSTEEDENKVNHEILRSEVLYMITDESIIDEDVLTKSLDPYSLMKNSGTYKSKFNLCGLVLSRTKVKISKVPFKVLDALALKDDFYLNLIDWSSENFLAVGLGSCLYLWNASTSKVTKLYDLGNTDLVTSVAWADKGAYLGVGTNSGLFQLWDPEECKLIKTLSGHESRIGTISWNDNTVSTGSRDKNILHRDIRCDSDFEAKLVYHKQEIWGLKWSYDKQYLASGGNDNKLWLWSISNSKAPIGKFASHQAAVKALAWSPHQHGLLASGGGTADRWIKFWNALSLKEVNSVETWSQVCNLIFSKNVNKLVSTHGYSQNQIIVWKYPAMSKVVTLTGHTQRVLYLAMSPCGWSIVAGKGDEIIVKWSIQWK